MNKKIHQRLKPLLGKSCCRARVGEYKSLSLGFGKRVYHHNSRLNDTYYGEWELGTYSCAWRIIRGNRILLAKNDTGGDSEFLTKRLRKIRFGNLVSIEQPTDIDVRIGFDSGIVVDFLATISENDEYFHIFGPDHLHLELSRGGRWTISKSNEPFTRPS